MRSRAEASVVPFPPVNRRGRARFGAVAASLAALTSLVAVVLPARAYYEDAHLTGDDARVTVDSAGVAHVEHALTWRLTAGQPHSIDLVGTEANAEPETTTTLVSDDGHTVPATVATVPNRGLRVTISEPKSLHHGQAYRLRVAYTVNLKESGELVRDGLTYRIMMKAPVHAEGLEGPKVTFALPGALEAPAPFVGEGGMADNGVTGTVKRDRDHDEVELVWPHLGRGEESVWAVRVSAKAFEAGRVAAAIPPPPRREEPAGPSPVAYGLVALLAAAYASLVGVKARRLEAAGTEWGRGLLPLRSRERAALAGAALFVGVSLQLVDASYAGVSALVVAMLASVARPSPQPPAARGPGHWLVLRPGEAFASARPRDAFDPTTLRGAWLALGSVVAFALVGRALRSTRSSSPRSSRRASCRSSPAHARGAIAAGSRGSSPACTGSRASASRPGLACRPGSSRPTRCASSCCPATPCRASWGSRSASRRARGRPRSRRPKCSSGCRRRAPRRRR